MNSLRLGTGLILVLGALSLTARADDTAPADRALIVVHLPAWASLRFGDHTTQQTGPRRVFVSPALTPGKSYTYKLTAAWDDQGLAKTLVRSVVVAPGQRSVVDFNAPQRAASAVEPSTAVPPAPKVDPAQALTPDSERAQAAAAKPSPSRSRTFLFTYETTVKDLPPGKGARIWIPLASSSAEQEVKLVTEKVPEGATTSKGVEKEYGNQILYVETKANDKGEIPVQLGYRVTRREVRTTGLDGTLVKVRPEEDIDRYLKPDVKVPITGKPLELIKDKPVPPEQFAAAKMFYDIVNKHMTYSKKGTGWGQGDSVWACDSKYGNCTDFHSLFISLARAEKIPSKFEMGFAIPAKQGSGPVGGYHCWAWFHPEGKGWIPVDISEANQNPSRQEYYFGNLTENRVQFTTGRDLTLVPRQSGGPLNFLIYPYVEVDGQPYPADRVEKRFAYQDAPEATGN